MVDLQDHGQPAADVREAGERDTQLRCVLPAGNDVGRRRTLCFFPELSGFRQVGNLNTHTVVYVNTSGGILFS